MRKIYKKIIVPFIMTAALAFSFTAAAAEQTETETHVHKYSNQITVQPTKTSYGEKTFTCECGDSYTEKVDPLKLDNAWFGNITIGDGQISFEIQPKDEATTYIIIYRRVNYGEAVQIAKVSPDEKYFVDTDVKSGEIYTYNMQAFNEVSCSSIGSSGAYQYLDTPQLSYTQDADGLHFSWTAVEGAKKYVLQKNIYGSWKTLLESAECAYTDTENVYGQEVTYRVYAKTEVSGYIKADECIVTSTLFGVPSGLAVKSEGFNQLYITWEKAIGAEGYILYRATSKDGEYQEVKKFSSPSVTSYYDGKLKLGQKYYYKVLAYGGKEIHWCEEIASGTSKMIKPTMETVHYCSPTSIKIRWEKVDIADGYYVYRKSTSGSWKKIATIKKNSTLSYTDKKAKGMYEYAVCAYKEDGGKKHVSDKPEPIKAYTLSKPTIKSITQVENSPSVKITWNKVKNANEYRVYRKIGSKGSWSLRKTTYGNDTSCTMKIEPGKTYYWKVIPVMEKDKVIYIIGEESKSKSYSFSLPKLKYDFVTSCSKTKKRNEIKIKIKNNGSQSLYIYSANAALLDGEESSGMNDRELKLVSSSGKKLSSTTLKKSSTKTLYFDIVGSSTRFHKGSVLQLQFKYDGLYYIIYISADGASPDLYYLE